MRDSRIPILRHEHPEHFVRCYRILFHGSAGLFSAAAYFRPAAFTHYVK